MAFTSILGSSENRLANIVLSAAGTGGAPPAHERDLTIAGNSAITVAITKTSAPTLVVAGLASCTVVAGFNFLETRTIGANAACNVLDGFRYELSQNIASNSAATTAAGVGYTHTLNIEGVSDLDSDFQYTSLQLLTIAGISNISRTNFINYGPTLTITAIGSYSTPGGLVLFNTQAIEGFASTTLLAGFVYTKTLDVEGISNISQTEQYLMQQTLSISGQADLTLANQFVGGPLLTIANVSQATLTSIMTVDNTVSFGAVSFIVFENLYNILLDTVAIAAFTPTVERFSNPTEQPAATGSFTAGCQAVLNRTVTQTLSINQQITLQKPTQNNTQSLTFNQSLMVSKVHIEEIQQTLTLTQEAIAARAIIQTLTLSQDAEAVRVHNRTITQTFTISQAVARNTVINRGVEQSLQFYTNNEQSIPIIGATGSGLQTHFRYTLESAIATLVPRKCLVVLGVPDQIIVLPCPIFGDSQSEQGTIDLKRTMTGDTFTYVRKQRLQKVEYSFHVGSRKAYEMKQFLLEHSYKLITMSNWKGETWLVMLANNPVEFVNTGRWQNVGERVEFTLQFEGIKVS